MTDDNPASKREIQPGQSGFNDGSAREGEESQPRTELNADEASIIVEAAAETPVTELVEPVDPFVEQATRILGPNYKGIEDGAEQAGLDFHGYVLSTCARLNDMEADLEMTMGEFQRSLAPEIWPPIESALSVNHTIENCRRGLMGLLQSGALQGQPAQAVADLFSNLSGATNMFVNATITVLLGQTVAGFDDDTVKRLIMEPFNEVMEKKRAIFDFLGEANGNFASAIMQKLASVATQAAADAIQPPPVVH